MGNKLALILFKPPARKRTTGLPTGAVVLAGLVLVVWGPGGCNFGYHSLSGGDRVPDPRFHLCRAISNPTILPLLKIRISKRYFFTAEDTAERKKTENNGGRTCIADGPYSQFRSINHQTYLRLDLPPPL